MLSVSIRDLAQSYVFFFFNDTATTEIYTLSLHDALPISRSATSATMSRASIPLAIVTALVRPQMPCRMTRMGRSEEHTSELQSRLHLVCRLLLEKKKNKTETRRPTPRSTP